MKKIFIITGEPSGDKLASTVISKLKMQNPDIEYLSVGGAHIKKLGIQSIFDLKEITYLGFTSVLFNIFKIRNKINITVDEKPTGEISAGAGFGTSGEVLEFGVRENNYLGKGLAVDSRLSLNCR